MSDVFSRLEMTGIARFSSTAVLAILAFKGPILLNDFTREIAC